MPRLLLDISSLARWTGPPVGMVRVQQELLRQLPAGAIPVFFDTANSNLRVLNAPWQTLILGEKGCIDLGDRIRPPSRYTMFLALEHHRLATRHPAIVSLAGLMQRLLMALRRNDLVIADSTGNRLARVPSGLALGAEITPGPDDVLLLAGSGWYHAPAALLTELKQRLRFQIAVICYDIIPLQRPDWFADQDATACKQYWDAMFPLADRLIVNSRVVAADIVEYCANNTLRMPPIRCVPLGATPPDARPDATLLPSGLQPERYALFVSTIEPRKGHTMLLSAWRQMLATHAGDGFRLVFVGRIGWNVDAVLTELREMQNSGQVLHLPHATDATLETLYRHAAFCLYPSEYEGFGLPVIEAFAHGKAVIASTGGALPEAAAGLALCLDPHDAAAWAAAIGAWISNPALRREAETKILEDFKLHGWHQAATALIDAALGLSPSSAAIPAGSAGADAA